MGSKAMCSLFKEFDQDVSGKLSQSEFINGMQRVLGRHGIRSFRKDVETLMSKVDKNKDGSVDFSEFYNHLQGDSDPDDARKQNKDSEIKYRPASNPETIKGSAKILGDL